MEAVIPVVGLEAVIPVVGLEAELRILEAIPLETGMSRRLLLSSFCSLSVLTALLAVLSTVEGS